MNFLHHSAVRHYEVVYLIHEDRVEEVEDVVSKVQGAFLNTYASLTQLYKDVNLSTCCLYVLKSSMS